MLYQKFELVKETNWDRVAYYERNGHSQIVYTKCGKKILVTHGSEKGTISSEVDIPALLYDKFDLIVCCYPKRVKTFFQIKYGKGLPIIFEDYEKTVYSWFKKSGNVITLEIADSKKTIKTANTPDDLADLF